MAPILKPREPSRDARALQKSAAHAPAARRKLRGRGRQDAQYAPGSSRKMDSDEAIKIKAEALGMQGRN